MHVSLVWPFFPLFLYADFGGGKTKEKRVSSLD